MKDIDFAVEKGFRLFEEGISFFHFFMIQVKIAINSLPDETYRFSLRQKSNHKVVFTIDIVIDSIHQRILTPGSHEDPLVSDEKKEYYLICLQLPQDKLDEFKNIALEVALFSLKNNVEVLAYSALPDLNQAFLQYTKKHFSQLVAPYEIQTEKDCVFRLHLGDEQGHYQEKEWALKAGERFYFKDYLKDYPYIGLQCSYENEVPEIEEKHIVIGQKGMTLSGNYWFVPENEGNNIEKGLCFHALLPFDKTYQILYSNTSEHNLPEDAFDYALCKKEEWKVINTIKEVLDYYSKNKVSFFESTIEFLEPQYRKYPTYGIAKNIVTIEKRHPSIFHLDLPVCEHCQNNHKCVQMIPSGLSDRLYKENLLIEDAKECRVYELIENKKSENNE
jgi:hypothetical protein